MCLVNVLQAVEFLHALLPFVFCIIISVKALPITSCQILFNENQQKEHENLLSFFLSFSSDLNERPNELISGARNALFETSSSASNPLHDTLLLGTTNPPSNTNSLISEESFCRSSARESDKKS